ncbi:MAG TPA: AMP-binding protein, partial [Alphaproteobacteria bacterium]|nr:AMP-binding protein [Alphaproteobacteria bacterium]
MTMAPAVSAPSDDSPLWAPTPARINATLLRDFANKMEAKTARSFSTYADLWAWSVDNVETFWDECWDYCGVVGDKGPVILEKAGQMPGAAFFPQGRLNYAENLLKRRDASPAIIFRDEKGGERTLTAAQLYDDVSRWAQAFRAAGLTEGDRVAGYMPNMPETIIAMLAAS